MTSENDSRETSRDHKIRLTMAPMFRGRSLSNHNTPGNRMSGLNRRHGSFDNRGANNCVGSLFSSQSLLILTIGILFGYILLLPVLLVEMQMEDVMGQLPDLDRDPYHVSNSPRAPLSANYLRPVSSDAEPNPTRTLDAKVADGL